jgi:hypothetical protein
MTDILQMFHSMHATSKVVIQKESNSSSFVSIITFFSVFMSSFYTVPSPQTNSGRNTTHCYGTTACKAFFGA